MDNQIQIIARFVCKHLNLARRLESKSHSTRWAPSYDNSINCSIICLRWPVGLVLTAVRIFIQLSATSGSRLTSMCQYQYDSAFNLANRLRAGFYSLNDCIGQHVKISAEPNKIPLVLRRNTRGTNMNKLCIEYKAYFMDEASRLVQYVP